MCHYVSCIKTEYKCAIMFHILKLNTNVTSWDKISRMSQFFHMEINIPGFRAHSVLQISEN